MNPEHWLQLQRTVRFGDTDAAGVMHFAQLLHWCHEAYEESLERFGIGSAEIFPRPEAIPDVALPIVHCSANFLKPLRCGDLLQIALEPRRLDPGCFELRYRFHCAEHPVAEGLTRHLAIETASRQRCSLPAALQRWLEASSLQSGVQPL
jgi:1,4-dihydroxy-2-naphthoyl-CoA hydrolase